MFKRVLNIFKCWGLAKGVQVLFALTASKMTYTKKKWQVLILEDRKYRHLIKNGYVVKRVGKKLKVQLPDKNVVLMCRRFSSDIDVVNQLVDYKEYDPLFNLIKGNNIIIRTVLDIGGNIGLSSILFNKELRPDKIVVVEPDRENFETLISNLSINKVQAIGLRKGIWSSSKRLFFDRNFRDGLDWSISLTEEHVGNEFVDAISMNDLYEMHHLNKVDLLKIDIEGGEKELFCGSSEILDFLDKTQIIAIEIHDELGIRDKIEELLQYKGFQLSTSGEYLIGVNARLAN